MGCKCSKPKQDLFLLEPTAAIITVEEIQSNVTNELIPTPMFGSETPGFGAQGVY